MDPAQREKGISGVLFDDHLDKLVIWRLSRVTRRPRMSYELDQLFGSLLVKRVADTSIIEATTLDLNVAKFVGGHEDRRGGHHSKRKSDYSTGTIICRIFSYTVVHD